MGHLRLMAGAIWLLAAMLTAASWAADATSPATGPAVHRLFAESRGDAPPKGLVEAYAAFVKTTEHGDVGALTQHCLPQAVRIVDRSPAGTDEDRGDFMKISFLHKGFSAQVFLVRKDPDDCWLVRTGSTAIWFVETKSGQWKIYRYTDKSIE